MYEELLVAINQLTSAVNNVSVMLAIIIAVLVLKHTNSNEEIRALRNDVNNVKGAISNLLINLCAELRNMRGTDDV